MMPRIIQPMLAIKAPQPFDSEEYIFELKYNGIRAIAFIKNGRLKLQSRSLRDITEQFLELSQLPDQLRGDKIVLDGEIVILGQGRQNLGMILSRIQITDSIKINYEAKSFPATYFVFDLLYQNGQSLIGRPLVERKARLEALIEGSERIKVVQFIEREGIKLFELALAQGLEGVMAKRKDSPYLPGQRSRSWQKFKKKRS